MGCVRETLLIRFLYEFREHDSIILECSRSLISDQLVSKKITDYICDFVSLSHSFMLMEKSRVCVEKENLRYF